MHYDSEERVDDLLALGTALLSAMVDGRSEDVLCGLGRFDGSGDHLGEVGQAELCGVTTDPVGPQH